MNGDMLSQDEIDALLSGGNSDSENNEQNEHEVSEYLNDIEQDAVGELGNISFGSSATALSTLLNQKVAITTPSVSVIDTAKLEDEFPHPYVAIRVNYTEGFSGVNILVIKQSDAAIIADLMLGGNGLSPADTLDDIHLSAVQEAMNQMMGSAATSMSSVFNKRVDISPPAIDLMNFSAGEGTDNIPKQNVLVKVAFRLTIGDLIDSQIMQVLPVDFAKNLVSDLMVEDNTQSTQSTASVQEPRQVEPTPPMYESSQPIEKTVQKEIRQEHKVQPQIQNADFMSFNETAQHPAHDTRNLDMLLDIPLQVSVELGKTSRTVKDILELGSGSILELDKLAGEPVDILVNNRLIAKGEVVVIDENFGVRVTDIVSKSDRLKNLN